MKKYFLSLTTVILAAVCFTSCAVTSHVESAPGVNFNNYKTFGWATANGEVKEDSVDNDIVDQNIKNSISMQLGNMGWKETTQSPDVILDYIVIVEKKVKQVSEPVYSYPYANFYNYPYTNYYYNRWHHRLGYIYSPYNLMAYHTHNIPFKEGVLTVNMIDAKTNKLIWQGSAQGDISSKTVSTQEVTADVKSIFKKFDYPKTNS
jgi:hypothetical protein